MSSSPFLLAITSLKPHAGRTTAAMALARAFGKAGHRTLLVDANRYPMSTPSKSKTGSAELWDGVVIGSRKAGEAQSVGAEIVVVDAPPLIEEKTGKILAGTDATVVTVFPIVQNKRFMGDARRVLEELDPARVLGWFSANVDGNNLMHSDLVADLRGELSAWEELTVIPSDVRVPHWDTMAAADPPEGEFEAAFDGLARTLLERMRLSKPERGSDPQTVDAAGVAGESPETGGAGHGPPGEELAEGSAPQSPGPRRRMRRVKKKKKKRRKLVASQPAPEAPASPEASAPEAEAETGSSSGEASPQSAVDAPQASVPTEGTAQAQPVRGGRFPRALRGPRLAPPAETTGELPLRWFGRRPRLGFTLMDLEGGFLLRPGTRLFPLGLPLHAAGAVLRCGLLHSLDAGQILGEHDVSRRRLRAEADPDAPGLGDPFIEALVPDGYGLHLAGDLEGALLEFEQQEGADARLLAGVMRLANGEHGEALEHLLEAVAERQRLGADVGALGWGVVIDVDFGNGVTTHFGANLRGAHMALAMAHLLEDQLDPCLEQIEILHGLGEQDDVLRALRAELLLERGTPEDLRRVHHSLPVASHRTALHVVSAIHRAEALAGIGLGEAALHGLGEALAEAPRPSPLRRAILLLRMQVAEGLGKSELARLDLELLCAEEPSVDESTLRLAS